MGALVDSEDLADWLGLTSVTTSRAELLLEIASDLVRSELGQVIDFVEDEEVELIGRGANVLLLPELPVWEVGDVETEDDAGTVTALVAGTDYRVELGDDNRLGILRRLPARNGVWRDGETVRVTYSHGYQAAGGTGEGVATLPGAIKATVLRAAARGYSNPTGKRQETISRYSYTDSDASGLSLTAGDRHDLDRFYPGHRAGAK